ncbi:MAG TPA: aldo/keto reductase family protein [Planctomycetota bacterium]|nr:aldo/keto reductase family protein [Planctomycetota bacterium]
MNYRQLGSSDIKVSEISLGSWLTFGSGVEREKGVACIKKAFDLGINHIDTANIYGVGAAESFLGEALKDYPRKSYVLGTKVFWAMSPTDRGLSAAQIRKQIDASLKRLQTDYVDIYWCHRYDPNVPLEETMGAMTEVVKQGKARTIGFSEWNAQQIASALKLPNTARFVASQPQYSMLWRRPETEVIPLCEKEKISQVVWSPLAQGVLTGKYKPGQPPPQDSRAAHPTMKQHFNDQGLPFNNDKIFAAVQKLEPIAARLHINMAQLAIAWVLRKPNVASAIVGVSRPEQLEINAKGSGVKLDGDSLGEIDRALEGVVAF